jgi:hypothetical protein
VLRSLEALRLLGPLSPPPRELLRSELPPSAQQFGGQRTGVSRTSGPSPCPYSPESLEGKISEVRTLPSPGLTSMSVVAHICWREDYPAARPYPPAGSRPDCTGSCRMLDAGFREASEQAPISTPEGGLRFEASCFLTASLGKRVNKACA